MGLRSRREDVVTDAANWTEPGMVGMVASAARVEIRQTAASRKKKQLQADWQEEAWHHFNRCGELQMAAQWMANSLSRIRLYGAEIGPDGRPGDPTKNKIAQDIAANLFGGPGAAAQVLAALGVHLTVPGDCYVVCEETADSDTDDWYVISTSELVKKGQKLGIDRGDGWRELDADTAVLIRVWNPHPQRREEATSATRAVLPVLRELEQLDKHVQATLDSRLAGAGILFIPDNIVFKPASPEAAAANPHMDPFLVMLTEAMTTAVEDRDSPSALVPVVAKVPAEAIDKIQHVRFNTELNSQVKEGREEGIRRLALGMDMPPEQLLGTGSANHWGSWQIEEGGVKVHVEPKAVTVCAALTESYYRPALLAAGVQNADEYVLWYDVTELVLRPNRADAAKALFDAGELKADVMLREAGFDPDTDAPDDAERIKTLLTKLILAQPDFAAALLPALGITNVTLPAPQPFGPGPVPELPAGDQRSPAGETPPGTGPKTAIPATEPKGDQGTPAQDAEGGDSFAAAAVIDRAWPSAQEVAVEALVSRGLEFAGKRLLTRARRGTFTGDLRTLYLEPDVAIRNEDIDRLLAGAWTYLPEVAAQVGLNESLLQANLVDHLGGLLRTGQQHLSQYSRRIVELSA